MEMKLPYLVVKIKIVTVLLTEKCHENRFGCTEYVKWNSRFVFSSSQIADTDVVVHLQYNLQMITLGRLYSFIDYKASGFSMTVDTTHIIYESEPQIKCSIWQHFNSNY